MIDDIKFIKIAVSVSELEYYADSPHWTVRCEVAKNPFAASSVLFKLAHDTRWEVQAYVVENPNADYDTFAYVLENGKTDALWYLAKSPYAPKDIAQKAWEKYLCGKNTGITYSGNYQAV